MLRDSEPKSVEIACFLNDLSSAERVRAIRTLRRLGLEMPETLLTNDPDRARAFASWLVSDAFTAGHPNVVAFDLFSALAIRGDKPKANTLVPQFGSGSSSEVSSVGAKAVGRMMIPFLNRQIERLALGQRTSRPVASSMSAWWKQSGCSFDAVSGIPESRKCCTA